VARPSRWGNPYRVSAQYRWADGEPCPYPGPAERVEGDWEQLERCETAQQAVLWYEAWITKMVPSMAADAAASLAGRDLGCWCPVGQPCHADVLLVIANAPAAAGGGGQR
jgi:hypothetical protein